jgi:hypothetical protein
MASLCVENKLKEKARGLKIKRAQTGVFGSVPMKQVSQLGQDVDVIVILLLELLLHGLVVVLVDALLLPLALPLEVLLQRLVHQLHQLGHLRLAQAAHAQEVDALRQRVEVLRQHVSLGLGLDRLQTHYYLQCVVNRVKAHSP